MRTLTVAAVIVFVLCGLGEAMAQKNKNVPTLLKDLNSKDASVRTTAAKALGGRTLTGTEKTAATAALVKALKDSHGPLRMEAATALGKLKGVPKTVVPALKGLLQDEESNVVRAAATALGEYGPAAKEASGELQEAAKNTDRRVAKAAKDALAKIRKK